VPGTFPGLAKAQLYPTKPVKIILPIPAGSPMDALGRIIANQLAQAVRYRQSTGRGTVFGGSRRGDGRPRWLHATADEQRALLRLNTKCGITIRSRWKVGSRDEDVAFHSANVATGSITPKPIQEK